MFTTCGLCGLLCCLHTVPAAHAACLALNSFFLVRDTVVAQTGSVPSDNFQAAGTHYSMMSRFPSFTTWRDRWESLTPLDKFERQRRASMFLRCKFSPRLCRLKAGATQTLRCPNA
jgi:hypothetical protein